MVLGYSELVAHNIRLLEAPCIVKDLCFCIEKFQGVFAKNEDNATVVPRRMPMLPHNLHMFFMSYAHGPENCRDDKTNGYLCLKNN